MDPDDKLVWDAAYNEEYDGLVSLLTWEVISEKEYNNSGKENMPYLLW